MTRLKSKTSLVAYASDASIYAAMPETVRLIQSAEDVVEAVKLAAQKQISVTARGGGTGLAGGAVGTGVIADFSNFRSILDIDIASKTVLTQVGIIYDELNLALKKFGLFFPPDPSSGDSCQIGGMLANNSSGPRSVKYGLTSDFVEELEIVKPSGKRATLKKLPLGSMELKTFLQTDPEFEIILQILQENKRLIAEKWPALKKNSSGYNLRQVITDLERGVFNLPALLVGSEGTLGLFLSARLRLLPLPSEILTSRLYFGSLIEAGRAVPDILAIGPSGLEIVDGSTLNLIGRDKFGIPGSAAALLLVEFDDDINARKAKFDALTARLNLVAPAEFASDSESTAALWRARKAIVPTLYRHHPKKRPLALIEDISLPPDQVPAFIEYATSLFDAHHLTYGIFGHIGDGNLHVRPLFDLNDKNDFELAVRIYNEVYDRVISLGGSTTAEHADGRLRAALVKKVYGEEIYRIFLKLKETLDPDHILAPGVVLSDTPFTAQIDYEKIKSYCAACGKCNGYCPAYDIFRREDFSPRGWLRIINQSGESRRRLIPYLSYCLNCKNCTIVCPAGVDIAAEIIKYRSEKPTLLSKAAVVFADRESLLGLSLRLAKIAEPLVRSGLGRAALGLLGKPAFGLDRTARFPAIAAKSLRKRFSQRIASEGTVALFHGCADNLLESSVGEAIFKVFDRLGIDISMPEQKCCGLPYEVYGHRENLLEKARYNIDHLNYYEAVITGCASCLLRLKEYEKLFSEDDPYRQEAEKLTGKCFDISQYLNRQEIDFSIFTSEKMTTVTYHNPCHLRAAGLHKEPEKLMRKLNNIRIIVPLHADRCCAQAGSFGFVHFRESKLMFAQKKEEYGQIEADYLMTSCPACQMKIRAEMGDRFTVVHPIEILANRLGKE